MASRIAFPAARLTAVASPVEPLALRCRQAGLPRATIDEACTPGGVIVLQQAADRPGALPARSQPFNRGRCQTVAKHRIRPRLVRAIPPPGGTPIGLQRLSAPHPPTKRIRALLVASRQRERPGSALPSGYPVTEEFS